MDARFQVGDCISTYTDILHIDETNITSAVPIKHSSGSAANPSITFSSATDIGFYYGFSTVDRLYVSANGTEVCNFNSTGIDFPNDSYYICWSDAGNWCIGVNTRTFTGEDIIGDTFQFTVPNNSNKGFQFGNENNDILFEIEANAVGRTTIHQDLYTKGVYILEGDAITSTSGAGAVAITGQLHKITTTGSSQALTLANGTNGQVLKIIYVAEGAGSDFAVLTPTTLAGGSTITFNDLSDSCELVYSSTGGWHITGIYGAVVA